MSLLSLLCCRQLDQYRIDPNVPAADSVERLQRYALPPSRHMTCFPSHRWNARRLLAAEHARLHKRMRRMAATESKLRKGLGKVL